ncbi:glyoxalase [Candidatus Thorarchaeota archaeon]|nr:MAG: glyoxalase [Candidatus Thorarchaeota archaeon]
MKTRIGLVTVLADDVQELADFYSSVLGFEKNYVTDDYVEFESEDVRFAICARSTMHRLSDHESYTMHRSGQSFELAFPLPSSEAVNDAYWEIVQAGATPIREPHETPWKRRTAMFADPEGNIHELYGPRTDE